MAQLSGRFIASLIAIGCAEGSVLDAREHRGAGGSAPDASVQTTGGAPSTGGTTGTGGSAAIGGASAAGGNLAEDASSPSDADAACAALGEKRCDGVCVAPGPSVGCGATGCDPCAAPEHSTAKCSSGACDFTCDTGFEVSGAGCSLLATCTDGAQGTDETDLDCGGICPACADGLTCVVDSDCASSRCSGGACAAPTCTDDVRNGAETSVDCGGGTCPTCADGEPCDAATDCASGVCAAATCQAPTCADGVQNGTELGTDCGDVCPACPAPDGTACTAAAECISGFCADGFCCDAACGGAAADCQACSVAAGASTDGVCAPLATGAPCRPTAGSCDVAETCDGAGTDCPVDGFAVAGTVCRGQPNICDVPETCSGTDAACPADAFAARDSDCSRAPVFTVYATGAPNANTADFASGWASRTLTGGVAGPRGWADVLQFTGTSGGTAGNLYDYRRFSTAQYVVQAGDFVEYDVTFDRDADGLGGIDVMDNSGTSYWRDLVWADQNALSGHPAQSLATRARGIWYHRRLAVPAARVGRTITRWDVALEDDDVNTTSTVYYDNVVVTRTPGGCDGQGTCKVKTGAACASGADCASGTCTASVCSN